MVDQPCCRTAHGQGFAQSGESQVAMQPVACCPADDPACEQVDDDGEIQPTFAGPDVGEVGAPLLVGPCRREVLIKQVRRHRPSVLAARGRFNPPLLPSLQAVVAHQPGYPAATDREAAIPQFPRHSGTAIGAVRQGKGRPDMCQQHHVVPLAAAGWPTPPGEIAALTNTKPTAQAIDGEFRFRPIDEREPHRLPSRAKKAVAFFRMSRSCRRISFSRRSRFSSAVISLVAADGSTARRSRLRPIQRTSVESPIPRSPAIARCVRPLVCTRRTASSSNSFVNRRCCVIEFLIAHRELSTLPKQVQTGVLRLQILQTLYLIALQSAELLAPAVIRYFAHPDRADCIANALTLRGQNVNLAQLGDDLFRLVALPWHRGPPREQNHSSGWTTSAGVDHCATGRIGSNHRDL